MAPPSLISVLLLVGVASSHPAPEECARSQMPAEEESDTVSALQSHLGGPRHGSSQLALAEDPSKCAEEPWTCQPCSQRTNNCECSRSPEDLCKGRDDLPECGLSGKEEDIIADFMQKTTGPSCRVDCRKCPNEDETNKCCGFQPKKSYVCVKPTNGLCVARVCTNMNSLRPDGNGSTTCTSVPPAQVGEEVCFPTVFAPWNWLTGFTVEWGECATTTTTTTTTTSSTTSPHCKPKCDYCKEICKDYRCGLKRSTCEAQCEANFYPIKCAMKKYCKDCCKNGECPEVDGETDLPELLSTGASEALLDLESIAEELDEQGRCKDFTTCYCRDFCKAFWEDPEKRKKCMRRCHEDPDALQEIFNDFCAHGVCDA